LVLVTDRVKRAQVEVLLKFGFSQRQADGPIDLCILLKYSFHQWTDDEKQFFGIVIHWILYLSVTFFLPKLLMFGNLYQVQISFYLPGLLHFDCGHCMACATTNGLSATLKSSRLDQPLLVVRAADSLTLAGATAMTQHPAGPAGQGRPGKPACIQQLDNSKGSVAY
jgi:hypothetical protein